MSSWNVCSAKILEISPRCEAKQKAVSRCRLDSSRPNITWHPRQGGGHRLKFPKMLSPSAFLSGKCWAKMQPLVVFLTSFVPYTQPSGRQRTPNENCLKLSCISVSSPQSLDKIVFWSATATSPLFYLRYPYFLLRQPPLPTIHLLTRWRCHNTFCSTS